MLISNGGLRVVWALTSCAFFACVAPPSSKEAKTAETPGESKVAVADAPKTPPPPGKLMVWDGDENSKGQPWADCSKKAAGCKSAVTPRRMLAASARGSSSTCRDPTGRASVGIGTILPRERGHRHHRLRQPQLLDPRGGQGQGGRADPANFKVVLSGSGNNKKSRTKSSSPTTSRTSSTDSGTRS